MVMKIFIGLLIAKMLLKNFNQSILGSKVKVKFSAHKNYMDFLGDAKQAETRRETTAETTGEISSQYDLVLLTIFFGCRNNLMDSLV